MMFFFGFLGFVILQRLSELVISRRNAAWMKARGGYERGKGHYAFAVILHTAFVIALAAEVVLLKRGPAWWWWIPLLVFVLTQGLRYRAMASLGRFWNTRIFVLPGSRVVRKGPYRYLRHPNYVCVVLEFLAIPLIFQAYWTLLVFSLLNALFLSIRIPAEDRALEEVTDNGSASGAHARQ